MRVPPTRRSLVRPLLLLLLVVGLLAPVSAQAEPEVPVVTELLTDVCYPSVVLAGDEIMAPPVRLVDAATGPGEDIDEEGCYDEEATGLAALASASEVLAEADWTGVAGRTVTWEIRTLAGGVWSAWTPVGEATTGADGVAALEAFRQIAADSQWRVSFAGDAAATSSSKTVSVEAYHLDVVHTPWGNLPGEASGTLAAGRPISWHGRVRRESWEEWGYESYVGAVVHLETAAAGSSTWTRRATTRTDASGSYQVSASLPAGRLRVRVVVASPLPWRTVVDESLPEVLVVRRAVKVVGKSMDQVVELGRPYVATWLLGGADDQTLLGTAPRPAEVWYKPWFSSVWRRVASVNGVLDPYGRASFTTRVTVKDSGRLQLRYHGNAAESGYRTTAEHDAYVAIRPRLTGWPKRTLHTKRKKIVRRTVTIAPSTGAIVELWKGEYRWGAWERARSYRPDARGRVTIRFPRGWDSGEYFRFKLVVRAPDGSNYGSIETPTWKIVRR
ncbi:hypothetical protein [Mumia sp. DW29H23]|uniref:hypothetical protein n=1 Tax=Mumia sp. DW29H23 TaxID=3421241 RepID=UPI003D69EA35